MPKGFYPNNQNKTQEIKDKISKSKKGKRCSIKTEFKKGNFIPHKKGCQCFRCDKNKPTWNKGLKGYMAGEKNGNWNNGSSFEPYGLEFNEDLKEVVRNRDRRKCQVCGKSELDNKERLIVHHIDYNKQNNNPNNLISLCRICHTTTNHKRDYWINYFKH